MRNITEKILLGCLLFVCVARLAAAQANTATPASADAQATTDSKTSSGPNNDFFGEALAGHWSFSTQFSFDQEYDDNVFSQPVVRLSDNVSRIAARFSAGVQKKKLRMQIHYYPNYAKYAKYSDRDALSHQFVEEMQYRFSGHTELNWTLSAVRIPSSNNSPFTLVDFDGVVLPVFRPDALQTNSTILNANSSVGWRHQFSAKDTLSLDWQGNYVQFSSADGVPLPALANKSYSAGATIRWENEFVPRRTIGLEVGDQYFGFLNPASHSHYQVVKVRYSQSFGRGYQFTIGAGPGRRENQLVSVVSSANTTESLDYAIDVGLTKSGRRGQLGVSYNHGSQLGLVQGSLGSDSLSFSAMRQLGRRWHLNGGFSYSRTSGESIGLVGSTGAYSASGGIDYQFTPDFGFNAGYSYVLQDLGQFQPGGSSFDRNVYRIGFRYTFQRITSR